MDLGLFVKITKTFTTSHRRCPAPPVPRCYACLKPGHELHDHVRLEVRSAVEWPGCGDDGTSSMVIWSVMVDRPLPQTDHPLDPDDFGRCIRLLAAPWAVGWRARIAEVGAVSRAWERLVARWDELEALFLEESPTGRCPKLYELLQTLGK